MATYCHSAVPDKGTVLKIIRCNKQTGAITVNYCNLGDAVGVLLVLAASKQERFGVRVLTEEQRRAYFSSQAVLWAGDGI